MCGIAGILNIKAQTKELRDKALKMAPENPSSRAGLERNLCRREVPSLAHERLSIVDPQSGGQPLYTRPTVNRCSP